MTAGVARVYACAAAAFVAFAVWGSLLPFHFRPVSLAEAARLLWVAEPIDPARFSLTDAVSNFLLFVPIGLFVAAAVERVWPSRGRTLIVLAAGTLLSAALEFGQAFVIWRTPSNLDVLAETAGMAAGMALRHIAALELDAAIAAALAAWRRATRAERVLLLYAVTFAITWLLPFDFTLRPDEIADKYEHKRLLFPFTPSPDALTPTHLGFAGLAAIPLAWACAVCGCPPATRRSTLRAVLITLALLVVLTLAQVTVFSRTTDLTVLVAMMPAIIFGAAAARMSPRPLVLTLGVGSAGKLLTIVLWFMAVISTELWPFRFDADADRTWRQIFTWAYAPFRPPATAFDVLPGACLAIAAGMITRPRLRPEYLRLQLLLAAGLVGMFFLWLEAGRLLLPGEEPTLVSVVIKTAAFLCGLTLAPAWPRRPLLSQREGT